MKKIITLTGALLISASLYADAPKGAYVGFGYGATAFTDGGFKDDIDKFLHRVSPNVTTASDYDSSGYKLYAGYQFNKIVAVEASYTSYGSYTFDFSNGFHDKLDPSSISIAANLGYNLGASAEYRPYGIIGLSALSLHETGNAEFYSDDSGVAIRFGFGFEYTPRQLKGFGFRVAYEGDFFTMKIQDADSVPELQETYVQSVGMLYLGASYKF